MSEELEQDGEQVLPNLQAALNADGCMLRYSLLRLNQELLRKGASSWRFVAANLPVTAQGKVAYLDFVLSHWDSRTYLLAKCVLPAPEHPNWCFLRAPFTHRRRSERIVVEYAKLGDGGRVHPSASYIHTSTDLFHVTLEVGSGQLEGKGQEQPRTFERAAARVSLGLSGLLHLFSTNAQFFPPEPRYFEQVRTFSFLPVIFTTANIWTSDVDLRTADLGQGRVDLSETKLHKQSWVLYQHSASPLLRHTLAFEEQAKTLEELVEREYVRTVPVVNPSGMEDFFRWAENLQS